MKEGFRCKLFTLQGPLKLLNRLICVLISQIRTPSLPFVLAKLGGVDKPVALTNVDSDSVVGQRLEEASRLGIGRRRIDDLVTAGGDSVLHVVVDCRHFVMAVDSFEYRFRFPFILVKRKGNRVRMGLTA